MADHQDIPLIQTLARLVDEIVEDAVQHAIGPHKETYNCILGWTHCPDHPKRERIVSKADAATLFAVLWDDRVLFLKVMATTVSPVLSSVIYLLWRYVIYERHLEVQRSPESGPPMSGNVFVQIFWRAYLTITPDQKRTFNLISSCTEYGLGFHSPNRDATGYNTPEDTKQIIRAFTNQTQRGSALTGRNVFQALSFIFLHLLPAGPSCDEEMPDLIAATMRQLWDFLIAGRRDLGEQRATLDDMRKTFDMFGEILKLEGERSSNPESVKKIVQVLSENELLDLVGGIFLSMNPTMDQSLFPHDVSRNVNFFKVTYEVFQGISKAFPRKVLVECFAPHALLWWKFYYQLQFLKHVDMGPGHSPYFYQLCSKHWTTIGGLLGCPVSSQDWSVSAQGAANPHIADRCVKLWIGFPGNQATGAAAILTTVQTNGVTTKTLVTAVKTVANWHLSTLSLYSADLNLLAV
ncbi:hypothetical protein FRC11_005497 [Ceratobasidium sp. 423]|nr:hypothetical protein FRC11_005497 [Ceratobasidium sp. 423]